jgi:hypothetical protein
MADHLFYAIYASPEGNVIQTNANNSFHSHRNAFFAVTDRIRVCTVTLFLRVQCMNNKDVFYTSSKLGISL